MINLGTLVFFNREANDFQYRKRVVLFLQDQKSLLFPRNFVFQQYFHVISYKTDQFKVSIIIMHVKR